MFAGISVLSRANILAVVMLWLIMIYLIDVWKLSLTHAAGIINVFMGSVKIMPLFVHFLMESFFGSFWMLLLSSFAYCVGLGFLTMSTPPVLANATGTCSEYKPECIGGGQEILFYIALSLIAVGMPGHVASSATFVAEPRINEIENKDEYWFSVRSICTMFLGNYASMIFVITIIIALPYIHPWSIRFGMPAIFTLLATLLLLSECCSYSYVRPNGSPLTILLRVLVASASKLFHQPPKDPNQLYEIRNTNVLLVPHTNSLRCLDKAAIILPDQTLEQQQENRWRLCRVNEVEVTKITIRVLPIWMTYIMCGLVSSMAYTYFLEQARRMNQKVGHLKITLPILIFFYFQGRKFFSKLHSMIAGCFVFASDRSYVAPFGMATSMIFSILCCITAAKVENQRLYVVKTHDLISKLDGRVPMSVFWLLPQFILLGATDGLFEYSAGFFLVDQVPDSWTSCMVLFNGVAFGSGFFASTLCVYIVGKVSRSGGKPSWFQQTLNESRLDKYYWTLAWLVTINLGVYILVVIWYSYNESNLGNGDDRDPNDCEDDSQCWSDVSLEFIN